MATEHTFTAKDGHETMVLSPTKAIRKKCLECSNFQTSEIEHCPMTDCALYPFRFGKDPGRKKPAMSEGRKEKLIIQLAKGRKTRSERIGYIGA